MFTVFCIYLCSYLYQCLFLHVDLGYCLVSFHFSINDSLYFLYRNRRNRETKKTLRHTENKQQNGRYIRLARATLVAQTVKNLPAMQVTWVQFLGWEDPLEEGMATHSSILDWRMPMDREDWQVIVHGVTESWT